jgi:hypothetical protein
LLAACFDNVNIWDNSTQGYYGPWDDKSWSYDGWVLIIYVDNNAILIDWLINWWVCVYVYKVMDDHDEW